MNHSEKARIVSEALEGAVNNYLLAKAFALAERERVDKIQRQVLQEDVYMGREIARRKKDEKPIRVLEPDQTWLLCDEDAARYYARMQAIHLENGFEDAKKGYCPALVAEDLCRKAIKSLIDQSEEFFGVSHNQLLIGSRRLRPADALQQFTDLLVGLVVNRPGYQKPNLASI